MATASNTESTKVRRPPTIDELTEMPHGPVWVRNNSTKLYKTGADVFITVYVGNQSRAHIVTVPLSWKPFNLTEQVPRAALLNSQHFLKAITSGALVLLNPQDAMEDAASPRAARETERLAQLQAAIAAAVKNPNADEFKLTLEGSEEDAAEKDKVSLSASFFDEEAVGVSFKAWVNKTNDMSVDDAILAAQARENFSTEELQYFADNTKHARIRKGLKKRLMDLANETADE